MDDTDIFDDPTTRPTASRPLLGQTVLAVEDSRYACEALRLLCLRSGARIRRADCLKSARRHLQIYRPTVLIVDVGLPDGNGADLIEEVCASSPRVPVVLGISGDFASRDVALAAGADGFLAKPIRAVAEFQAAILAHLPAGHRPMGPYAVADDQVQPDPVAYRDDMAHVAEILTDSTESETLEYVAQFLHGVARAASDETLAEAAARLARHQAQGRPIRSDAACIAGLVQERLQSAEVI